jgi:leukotriene-A4 hydrolase
VTAVTTFGQPLTVTLPQELNSNKFKITIEYETDTECSALQWLPKKQTSGKQFPYVYSQCQAILARSLFPCQDTPSVKATYSAEVTAPADLTVLMSAVPSSSSVLPEKSLKCHKFEQKIPIPSYLVAIVVGKLKGKKIGPRTTVWSEPEFVEQGAYDFSETEDMLQAAEKIMGKYVWGIYDILILPPSFPYGGMENPCLTFVTPTLLTGDKSLATVIAHEISHSWTGNLATNKTFEDFWLNEGFTMFAERKIGGLLKGEAYRQFQSIGGWKVLKETVNRLGETNPLTRLVPDLRGVDPDDAFSYIPYEKGYAFLYYLEEKVGGPAVFDIFLRDYLKMNEYKCLDSMEFKEIFINYFTSQGSRALIQDVDWDTWFYAPGMPPYVPKYDQTLAQACIDLSQRWITWDTTTPSTFSKADFEAFKVKSEQIQEFLAELRASGKPLSLQHVQAMQKAYDFNSVKNAEIRCTWLRLCIAAKWIDQLPLVLQFVTDQGALRYIRPLYRDLYAWEQVRAQAIETFQRNRPSMMYVSAHAVSNDLHLGN